MSLLATMSRQIPLREITIFPTKRFSRDDLVDKNVTRPSSRRGPKCQPPSFAVMVHSSLVCISTRSPLPKQSSRLETRTVCCRCRTNIQSTGLEGLLYPHNSTPRTTDSRTCLAEESLVSKVPMLFEDSGQFLTRIAEPLWKVHQDLKADLEE